MRSTKNNSPCIRVRNAPAPVGRPQPCENAGRAPASRPPSSTAHRTTPARSLMLDGRAASLLLA
eukprot:10421796-Alexandrium_andersonii.AAC.1